MRVAVKCIWKYLSGHNTPADAAVVAAVVAAVAAAAAARIASRPVTTTNRSSALAAPEWTIAHAGEDFLPPTHTRQLTQAH